MNILIIGGGNMGFTYANGITDNSSHKVNILERNPNRIIFLRKYQKIFVHTKTNCITNADIILLAIKPQQCLDFFEQIKHLVKKNQIFISIMAGISIKTIQQALGTLKIARAMPNLPAQLGKGMTGFICSSILSTREIQIIKEILSSTGKVLQVSSEEDIDKITGISGSGPAYVFYFLDAMIQEAKNFGFDEKQSKMLITQTFEGALALFQNTDKDLSTLINQVSSKGGTTRAALDSLNRNKVSEHIRQAIVTAYQRAVELANF